jgi:hypothetical protein
MKLNRITEEDLKIEYIKGVDQERERVRIILEFLLNKHGSTDECSFSDLLEDMEDLESDLIN